MRFLLWTLTLLFATKTYSRLEPGPFSHHIRYPKLNLEADARPPDFAGWVTAKRVEIDFHHAVFCRGNDGRLPPNGDVVANLESKLRKLYEAGGDGSEWRFCRQTFLRGGNLWEIAMSGSHFDDVLRHPPCYGIENTSDKVRRRALFDEDVTPCVPGGSLAIRYLCRMSTGKPGWES